PSQKNHLRPNFSAKHERGTDMSEKSIKPWNTPRGYDVFEDWAYVIDDAGIAYGPGWWPFVDSSNRKPVSVRVSPDWAFYSWGTEYVVLWSKGGSIVEARISVYEVGEG